MMQMQFTRLGRKKQDRHALPDGVSATDLAIGQLLGLADSAGFRFDVMDGCLVTVSANANFGLRPAISICLDDIGVDAIIEYFERTTPKRRKGLSAPA